MPDRDYENSTAFDNEDTEPLNDQALELTRSAERFSEKTTSLGIISAWEPTVEITHAFEPTFLADHLGSNAADETGP